MSANDYAQAMASDLLQNQKSRWLESFCQRAMLLRTYSAKNVARILEQMPNATMVAGRKYFSERGLEILPTAAPMKIWAPVSEGPSNKFAVVDVYDISQTTAGRRKYLPKVVPEQDRLRKIYTLAQSSGIKVYTTSLPKGQGKKRQGLDLFLQQGLSSDTMAQLIVQEMLSLAYKKENPSSMEEVRMGVSVTASYCIMVAMGAKVPAIPSRYHCYMCGGNGLLINLESACRLAKRVLQKIRKIA